MQDILATVFKHNPCILI